MEPTHTINKYGTQRWWLNEKLHREDGPAVIRPDGSEWWYLNGNLHREDGPTITHPDGTEYWWLNGKHITQKVNDWANERNVDLNNMSDTDKMVLKTELKMWK